MIAHLGFLAALSTAHAGLSDAELLALRQQVQPLVEQAAGRAFQTTPAVDARAPGGIGDVIEKEAQGLAHLFYPELGPRALGAFLQGGRSGRNVYGKFGLFDQTVYVRSDIAKAWKLRRKALGLDAREDETEENLAACVLAHELAHALQFENSDLEKVVQSGDMEQLAAWNAMAEGHAVQIARAVCTARGTPELMGRLEIGLGFDGPGPGPEAGELQTTHEAGLRFVEAQPDVWSAFGAPPTDTRMVYRPDRYVPGAAVVPFPAWPALETAALSLVDGEPSLLMGDRVGFQTLQPLVRRSEAGERALDGLVAAHLETVARGIGVVEVMVVHTTDAQSSATLLQAFREHEAWRVRPERKWRSATYVEAPEDSPGPAGGWHSKLTVRPAYNGDLGAETAVWAASRGRWVVRIWTSQRTLPDETMAATLDGLLASLPAPDSVIP